jgi:hypothetical protein
MTFSIVIYFEDSLCLFASYSPYFSLIVVKNIQHGS